MQPHIQWLWGFLASLPPLTGNHATTGGSERWPGSNAPFSSSVGLPDDPDRPPPLSAALPGNEELGADGLRPLSALTLAFIPSDVSGSTLSGPLRSHSSPGW